MALQRLDQELVQRGLVSTRSQAASYIKLGLVKVNDAVVIKPSQPVGGTDTIQLLATEQYVSRAALKLASVADKLGLSFKNKVVLDVGSSTGGFTDYALQHGAQKVIAVDVGTNQLHPTLRTNPRIELHEQTDIRNFAQNYHKMTDRSGNDNFDVVLVDVSFISLRVILPYIAKIVGDQTQIVAMVKPQFETGEHTKHKGVIKNDHLRRDILRSFEAWAKELFVIRGKADSKVSGSKGNVERFYLLRVV
mgnify:CR=1 FL=1